MSGTDDFGEFESSADDEEFEISQPASKLNPAQKERLLGDLRKWNARHTNEKEKFEINENDLLRVVLPETVVQPIRLKGGREYPPNSMISGEMEKVPDDVQKKTNESVTFTGHVTVLAKTTEDFSFLSEVNMMHEYNTAMKHWYRFAWNETPVFVGKKDGVVYCPDLGVGIFRYFKNGVCWREDLGYFANGVLQYGIINISPGGGVMDKGFVATSIVIAGIYIPAMNIMQNLLASMVFTNSEEDNILHDILLYEKMKNQGTNLREDEILQYKKSKRTNLQEDELLQYEKLKNQRKTFKDQREAEGLFNVHVRNLFGKIMVYRLYKFSKEKEEKILRLTPKLFRDISIRFNPYSPTIEIQQQDAYELFEGKEKTHLTKIIRIPDKTLAGKTEEIPVEYKEDEMHDIRGLVTYQILERLTKNYYSGIRDTTIFRSEMFPISFEIVTDNYYEQFLQNIMLEIESKLTRPAKRPNEGLFEYDPDNKRPRNETSSSSKRWKRSTPRLERAFDDAFVQTASSSSHTKRKPMKRPENWKQLRF